MNLQQFLCPNASFGLYIRTCPILDEVIQMWWPKIKGHYDVTKHIFNLTIELDIQIYLS